jgi:hypothetical protein
LLLYHWFMTTLTLGGRRLRDASGKTLCRLPLPRRRDYASTAVFALPKGGSTMLAHIVRDLCQAARVRYVSFPDQLFRRGVDLTALPEAFAGLFEAEGYCFGGFRQRPRDESGEPMAIPSLDGGRKVLLVRDPRDMLVSHYFSMRFSHPKPGGGRAAAFDAYRERIAAMDVDAYVLEHAGFYEGEFAAYGDVAADAETLVLRYEDVLYDKAGLVRLLCEHLRLEVSAAAQGRISARHDTIPKAERPDQHIRRAHPGDHAEKLRGETTRALNERLAGPLAEYGYLPA